MQSAAQSARNRLGVAARCGSPADVEQARRDLAAAKLEEHIRHVVDGTPPLTDTQRERLALLLSPGTGSDGC